MDGFFILLGLLLLAFPVIAIVALVKSIGAGEQLRRIEIRLGALERQPAAMAAAAAAPEPSPVPQEPVEPETTHATEPFPPAQPQAAPQEPPTPPPQEPPVVAAAPAAPSPPAQPEISLEERFGTQWVVWVGGVAIALSGFFMVRYSIEQGYFGPGMRVFLGALLALALIAAGEWTRRKENLTGIAGIAKANIPSILTAAGTTIAYADVWAAYGLYDFIGAATAFVLLGLVALATLAAALLHGPALAGLGLVGAYVTPLIVASDKPNYWALYLYLAIVTAAAFTLARVRLWRWLAVTALLFSLLWTFPGIADTRVDWLTPHDFHVVVGFVLATLLIVSGFLFGPDATPGAIDPVSSAALAAFLLASALIVVASGHDPLALMTYVALVAATIWISWRAQAATAAVPAAALLTMLVFADWALELNLQTLILPSGPTAGAVPEPERALFGWHLVLGIGFSLLFGAAGYMAQGRSERPIVPMLWAASAVFAPIAILVALYYRIAGFDRSVPFAGVALLLAVLFAFATEALDKRAPRPGLAAAGAIFATGAVAALALALTMMLEKGWLTLGLALMVPGIAYVSDKRPLPALRWLAAVILALVMARIAWEPRIVGRDVGTTPIFNWLLYGYGIPTAAFWLAGHILRRRADDVPARMMDSAALLFGVLLAFLEIRHLVNHGDIFRDSAGLSEVALHVCVGLAMTIGLERLRLRTNSIIHNVGALIIAGLTLMAIVFGLLLGDNPLYTGEPVGGRFINLILLGYGLPAVLAVALALVTRGLRPRAYSVIAAVVSVVLALAYLSLEVRTFFHGTVLTGAASGAEQYTYSTVWLAFGVALLAIGIFLRAQSVRFASAAVVILTVLKVFLFDMGNLTGIYQALSLLGLGVVLIGIGWFYQRLLFPRRLPAGPPPT
jgi:uncharacterized membrane protein